MLEATAGKPVFSVTDASCCTRRQRRHVRANGSTAFCRLRTHTMRLRSSSERSSMEVPCAGCSSITVLGEAASAASLPRDTTLKLLASSFIAVRVEGGRLVCTKGRVPGTRIRVAHAYACGWPRATWYCECQCYLLLAFLTFT
jgi:hypothetical protein